MRSLWFFPLTFLAGAHGFAVFAPYAAVCLAALIVVRRQRRKPVPVPVPVEVTAGV